MYAGDILITRSGHAGNAAIVPDSVPPANSADIIIIRLKPGVSPYATIAFINSSYGRFQIERQVSGGLQGHLNLTIAQDIQIPEFSPDIASELESAIQEALALKERSRSLYVDAASELHAELGVSQPESYELAYETDLAHIQTARRCDSRHFRPEFERLENRLKRAASTTYSLRDIVVFNDRGRQPVYVPDGPIAVVNSQHIDIHHLAIDELEATSRAIYDSDTRSRLYQNDVIVYATGAYVGRTNIFEDFPRSPATTSTF